MALNQKQQLAFDRVVKDKAPITFLTSSAGCGKSHTTAAIAMAIPSTQLTATSHKAKSVLSQMTGMEAKTVHKYMNFTIINKNYKQQLIPYQGKIEPCRLLVVDEVSMLPNVILTAIFKELESMNPAFDQVLFVGDAIQLPAVSNAPNLKKLEEFKVELTEQMRQDECPILSNYFSSYRQAIENKSMPASLMVDAPAITIHDDHKEFCRAYLQCDQQKRIIVYRNKVVDKYNSYINEGDVFNVNDRVIIDKPIASINAHNKDTLTILAIDTEIDEDYYAITLRSDSGGTVTVRHYKLTSELNRQLELLKSADREDEYWALFNMSFRLKHVYTSTVHAVQGDSIDVVFLDAYDIISAHQAAKTRYNNPISQDMMLRLLYVAISRMKVHCHIYTGVKPRNYAFLEVDVNKPMPKKRKKKEVTEPPKKFSMD